MSKSINIFHPTNGQKYYIEEIKKRKIVLCCGVAGTGKTSVAVKCAIRCLMDQNNPIEKIVITRRYIGADVDIGFLPGKLESKMSPYTRPIIDEMMVHGLTMQQINDKLADKIIEVVPITFARGRNFHNTFVIVDEVQNCTLDQVTLLLTRFGRNSRMVLCGDPSQSDVKPKWRLDVVGIGRFLAEDIEDFGYVELGEDDIMREEIVKEILKKLKEYKVTTK